MLNQIPTKTDQNIPKPQIHHQFHQFTPCGGDPKKVNKLVKRLFDRGVMCFIAGSNPMRIRFLLPIGGLTDQQMEDAWEIIEPTLEEA